MTIENQLFSWKSWDGNPEDGLIFDNVTLKVDIGKYTAGTKFDSAVILQADEETILQLQNVSELECNGIFPHILMGEYKLCYEIQDVVFEKS